MSSEHVRPVRLLALLAAARADGKDWAEINATNLDDAEALYGAEVDRTVDQLDALTDLVNLVRGPQQVADETYVDLGEAPVRPRRHLAQALDWTLWGVGMADMIRVALSDKMITALSDAEFEHAEALIVQGDAARGGPANRNYFLELQRELAALTSFVEANGLNVADVIARHTPSDEITEHYRTLSARAATHWEAEARRLQSELTELAGQREFDRKARRAASAKIEQITELLDDLDPVAREKIEEVLHPQRRTAVCASCGDPLVWHPGNGGQWLGSLKGRDWATCHGSVDSERRHVVEVNS